MVSTFLLVVSDRQGLSWILGSGKMAFSTMGRSGARNLKPEDNLILYTTRACYHNPNRNEGRVIGRATVTSTVSELGKPIIVSGKPLPYGCSIHLDSLASLGQGVSMRSAASQLEICQNTNVWGSRLRRTIVPLSDHDSNVLIELLHPFEESPDVVISSYLQWFP